MVLLGLYACGKTRRGVIERNERCEFNELLLHCDSDGLADRKLLKLSILCNDEFRDSDKKLLLFKSMLIGVRERGNESFGISFGAFDSVGGCDKSLDVELGVIFRMGFGTFGGSGGRGTTIFSTFSPFAAAFIGITLGRAIEFIDSFTKSFTN